MSSAIVEELIAAGLPQDSALTVASILDAKPSSALPDAASKWREISKKYLSPQIPFKVHQSLFELAYPPSAVSSSCNYIWSPSESEISNTNIAKLLQKLKLSNYDELYAWSASNREKFWSLMTQQLCIQFSSTPSSSDASDASPAAPVCFDTTRNKEGVANPIYYPNCRMNAVDTILRGTDDDLDRPVIVYAYESDYSNSSSNSSNTANISNTSDDSKQSETSETTSETTSKTSKNSSFPALRTLSLRQLREEASRVAHGLRNKLKLNPGDAVAIDMPMNWESVACYLGIIKAGLSVVSIADSFAPQAIDIRLKLSNCRAVFTQDVIPRGAKQIPLYERVLKCPSVPDKIIVVAADYKTRSLAVQLRDSDLSWDDFVQNCDEKFESEQVDSMAVANILFSSGTTGEPKAIPWHHGTFIKPIADGYLHNDVKKGEVVAWPTNVGWMMGPWLIAQIANESAIALFVGSPLSTAFCKFVEEAQVAHLGVIPSLVKAWMKMGSVDHADWSRVRRFSSTGEASNPNLYHWLVSRANYAPVLEYVGGTEIAGGFMGGSMVQPQLLSSFSCRCLGSGVHIIDPENETEITLESIKKGGTDEGELMLTPPSMGLSVTLLNKDHFKVYYQGTPSLKVDGKEQMLRRHGDQVRLLPNGYYQHLGRCDDTMNLGGIKVSSIELENALIKHPLLSRECAAISYRKQAIDAESLVVCAVPKNAEDTFEITLTRRPFGFKLGPAADGVHTVVSALDAKVDLEDEKAEKGGVVTGSVLYKIGNDVVYDLKYEQIVQILTEAQLPVTVQFIKQGFDVGKVVNELRALVKKEINPLFKVHDIYVVTKLPRTASGKVMRRILRSDYARAVQF